MGIYTITTVTLLLFFDFLLVGSHSEVFGWQGCGESAIDRALTGQLNVDEIMEGLALRLLTLLSEFIQLPSESPLPHLNLLTAEVFKEDFVARFGTLLHQEGIVGTFSQNGWQSP